MKLWHPRHTIAIVKPDMATITERFGAQVRKIRKQKRMSQEEVAVKAKLDVTTVSEIESGQREPMLKTIWKLSNAMSVQIKDLFSF